MDSCEILLISGSLRQGSVNAAVLQAARELVPEGATATIYDGLAGLPHFNPDDDREPLEAAVAQLRAQLDAADAVLFSTPEYAGALPGSFKNLLDWTVGGGMYAKPAAWINASPYGAAEAYASLRTVLGYVGAEIVESACVHIPVVRDAIDSEGQIHDSALRDGIARVMRALAQHVANRTDSDSTVSQ